MIGGFLRELGFEVHDFGIVEDDPQALSQAFRQALSDVDLLVTTGGASVGERDYIKPAFAALDAQLLYWKTTIHPGGASLAHRVAGKLALNLSGNPGAATLALLRVALPALKKALGHHEVMTQRVQAVLLEPLKKASPKGHLLRGHLVLQDGVASFAEHTGQGGAILRSLLGCDALAEIPPGTPPLAAGERVDVLLISD